MIFDPDSTFTLDNISQELVRGLPGELSDPAPQNKLWTMEINKRLYLMGKERGMFVCCHGSSDNGEWLLDVVWMAQKRREIVLAVESEWGNGRAIRDDFEKLMSIKTQRKLLIFGGDNNWGADVVGSIESYMRAYPYHLKGEEYMALNMNAQGAFRHHFKVPSDGCLDAVSFKEIEPLRWAWMNSRELPS